MIITNLIWAIAFVLMVWGMGATVLLGMKFQHRADYERRIQEHGQRSLRDNPAEHYPRKPLQR